ncbi:hypothetical protein HU200_065571 [Digitaria exilis]|uniref:Uncharacterized protein n=1 Tax=Digitaria exilis TaxID=1010633 RepID=A0A834ZZT3_9POAL|nr:hypothetical protein HU200_065571 [Digitaria exilis]
MVLNSSKLSTPSPLRSNLQIMALHSSISWCEPSLLSIRFRLSGVMHPSPFISYMPNASLSPRHLSSSSSLSACTSFMNSSWLSSPSPSVSTDATRSSASSADTSSPSAAFMQSRSSAAEILPSSSRSNAENTRLNRDVVAAAMILSCTSRFRDCSAGC